MADWSWNLFLPTSEDMQKPVDVGAGNTGGNTGGRKHLLVEPLQSCLTSLPPSPNASALTSPTGRSLCDPSGTAFPTLQQSQFSGGALSGSSSKALGPTKPTKRRSRLSRRVPTMVVEASVSDFRDMVQRLTGKSGANSTAISPQIDIISQDLDATGNLQLEGLDQARSVQDLCNTYIQFRRFEDFCCVQGIHGEEMAEIGRGRLTAALFQGAFYHHLETLLMAPEYRRANLPHLFLEAADMVVKDLPYATKNLQVGESQSFQFFDEVHTGDPVDVDIVFSLGGLVAICQNFLQGEERNLKDLESLDLSSDYCIVHHNLTSTYLCRRVVTKVLEDRLIENAIGILGVEVTNKDIHVENIRDDGSYYSGTLEDFSYPFVVNINGDLEAITDKQCATRLFGHLKGAEFLVGKEYGLKCSPLLAIALTIATQRKGTLALKWNSTHGHMEFDNIECFTRLEKIKWQVLYIDKINQLGLDVEWGMEQVIHNEMTNSLSTGTSNQSPVQALAAVFTSGVQQKRAVGLQLNLPGGVGIGGSIELFGSKGKELAKEAHPQILEHLRRDARKFVEASNIDSKHAHIKDDLLQGRLPDASCNYLVVWDSADNGHVSVYWAMEDGKLEWITDVFLPCGKGTSKNLFKGRLKGLHMKVKRDGSRLVSTNACKSTSDLISRFKKHKKLDIDSSMKEVPLGSHSNNEWEHLIGHQEKYAGNKYLWEATYMQAIISSRTSYLSGAILETFVEKTKFGEIGHCRKGKCDVRLVHHVDKVVAWGQFSKAPISLLQGAKFIKWGGLVDENDLC